MSVDIILPSALAAANADISRADLWNKAEISEKRKDARVAREWLVNLPHELSEQDRKTLARKFAQTLADRYGTIADCAIHKPTPREIDRGADPRNFHAHIMFTTRSAELDDNNEIILTSKASIELSDDKRRSLGMERVSHEIKEVHQLWEQIANEKLAEHNHELIDSRSYAEQGIDIEPQLKMGSVATKLERDKYEQELKRAEQAKVEGKHYEIDKIPATQLGTINEIINERNELVWGAALAKNQMVNDAADAIILNGHKIKDIEHSTLPPTKAISSNLPMPKSKALTLDAVAQAMAMAKGVATRKANEQKQKDLVLEQQRQHELAEQQKREQAERERIEQARADRVRQQQAVAEQLERESQLFLADKKALYAAAIAQSEQHTQKGIDLNSKAGTPILAISVANKVMHNLNKYMDNPDTTQRQRELAVVERERLTEITTDHTKQALSEIKNLHYTSDRKTHTAALQDALTKFSDNHGQSIDKDQQQALQSVQQDIADYRNEINRRRSYGLGR